jgi:hypothetical protein
MAHVVMGVYSLEPILSQFEQEHPQTVKVTTFPIIPNFAQTLALNYDKIHLFTPHHSSTIIMSKIQH